jgi:hypothetical protein
MIEAPLCRTARAVLNWSEEDLAHAAWVSTETVRAFEDGADLDAAERTMLQLVLENAGLAFVLEGNGDVVICQVRPRDAGLSRSEPGNGEDLVTHLPANNNETRADRPLPMSMPMTSLVKFPAGAPRLPAGGPTPMVALLETQAYADAIERADVQAANDLLAKAFPVMASRVHEVRRLCDACICEVTFHYGMQGASGLQAVSIKRFL